MGDPLSITLPADKAPPDTACEHCTLPVGSHPVGQGPYFCCVGCATVYQALQSAGFGSTYYRLRDQIPELASARPAAPHSDDLRLSELDTEAFMEAHTRAAGEGARSVALFLDGVHCAACVWLVERLPFELDGVLSARLDLPRARLHLHFRPETTPLSAVARWLARFGYAAAPVQQDLSRQRTRAEQNLLIKMGISWALAGNVMLFAFALYSGLDRTGDPSLIHGARWASLVLALISVLYGGSAFFRRALASIQLAWRARRITKLHIDTPISIGILVGFVHSAWATVAGKGDVWFDSITVLIAALLTARWLQMRSRRLAGDASDRLLSMIPSMARRIVDEGASNGALPRAGTAPDAGTREREIVRVDRLQAGDLIEVPAGEVFPVDGRVIWGISTVNKSVLTGESRPEPIEPGLDVEAGATNLQSPVCVQVARTGDQTRVGRLLAWIQEQHGKKAPIVLLADTLSGYFVAGILLLAIVTGAVWALVDPAQAAPHVVALLVISCPCALGMATPLAMAVAAGRAAQKGLFIKSDEAMQLLTGVDVVVLDKTGTLTEGALQLMRFAGDEAALRLAACLESMSNHPIARALTAAAGAGADEGRHAADGITAFRKLPGNGLRGCIEGRDVAVGRPAWLASFAAFDDALAGELDAYSAAGFTPVGIAVEGRLAAAVALGDKIRDDAPATLNVLRRAGKTIYIASGDHEAVVRHVADALGIPPQRALGNLSPEQKHGLVERLQQDAKTVAMVGDGVNDAAALQAAHVGIAVQGGSTPSLVAADVFTTREGLRPVVDVLSGAHAVMSVIRRNLAVSLLYNVLGASAAMFGFVTPLVAAIAMPLSSIFVVTSSVLQRSFSASETGNAGSEAHDASSSNRSSTNPALNVHPASL